MPKIGFRAKSVTTGEWLYGFPNDSPDVLVVMGMWKKIIPETICEFTRILDKHKKAIYEGDIIRVNWLSSAFGIFKVEFIGSGFVARFVRQENLSTVDVKMHDILLSDIQDSVEIIGNVFDDSVLLEKETKPTNKEFLDSLCTSAYAIFLSYPSIYGRLPCDCDLDASKCTKDFRCTRCFESWLNAPLDPRLVSHISSSWNSIVEQEVSEYDDHDSSSDN